MTRADQAIEADTRTRVLIVEDRPSDADLMRHELLRNGLDFDSLRVQSEPEFREALGEFKPDIILADYELPRFSGMRALRIVQRLGLDTPVILVSGAVTEETALECLRGGVADYLLKENLLRLGPAVAAVLEGTRIRREKEASQRHAEALSTIAEDSLGEIYVFAADTLRFLFVNRAASRNLGYTQDELLGLTPLDLKPEFTRGEFESKLRLLPGGDGGHLILHTVHRRKDETEYPVEVHLHRREYLGEHAFVAFVLNLAEREQAESQRASLEMRLSTFADSTTDAMIVVDAEGRIRFWNRAATSMFGFTADEILCEPLATIIPERLRARHRAGLQAALSRGVLAQDSPTRTTGLHKSGAEVPVELTLGSWTEGGESFFSAVMRDVTELLKTEEQLRASTRFYRTILEHLPIVTYEASFSEHDTTLWFSPQVEELLGTSAAEWADNREYFFERIHPEDRGRVRKAVASGRESGSIDIEYRISHADGHFLWIRERGLVGPGVSSGGERVLRGVLVDITESKESERERTLLSAAVEQSSDLVMITDTEANIQYVNTAFETITGYTREEAIGKNPRILSSGKQPPSFYEEMWAQLTAGRPWTREFVNRRKDGTEYCQRSTVFPIHDAGGRIQNLVGIGTDVSKERALENQLRQAQKMEAVGQLTGGISHDFNNLLATILTNAQLLAMALPPELTEEAADVRGIETAARRGADLIKRLMAFSRDEHLDLELVDPSEILEETVGLLKRVLPENIELVRKEAHDGALVNVDRSAIQQILMNLATNARDAMPMGGKLTISTTVVVGGNGPAKADGDARVEITVSDSGVGMDPETMERAFEPFFTTKNRGKGTGLGLAMVQALVGRHSGTIDATSEPGAGTTFTIGLPVAKSGTPRPEKPDVSHLEFPAVSGLTLLLVEDEAPLLRAGQRALEQVGYRVLVAENGLKALDVLRKHSSEIALVVTDMIMPEAGGVELYEATSGWEHRPAFLITSGYSPSEMSGPVLEDGVPFLRKPWDVTDLLQGVKDALQGSRQFEVENMS